MAATSQRFARLRRLALREADALLLTHPPDVLYLTGFRGSSGVLVLTRGEALLVTDGRYRVQAGLETRGARVSVVARDPLGAAAAWLRRRKARRVACEPQRLTVAQLDAVQRVCGPRVEFLPLSPPVAALRAVKDEGELARLRAALALAAQVFQEILPLVRPGVRELDLAAELDYRMKRQGASGPAFDTIVASGPRAALPHARPSLKRLQKNEFVIFDLGAILDDYRSDMTRTVYLGAPSAREKKIYGAVREALARARRSVRHGVGAARVDAAARSALARRGLASYFVHGTGHGLGLETHEAPRVAATAQGNLVAGNVITLEPGVYLPRRGGVRLEDVVVVRRRGAETLTPLGTELLCL